MKLWRTLLLMTLLAPIQARSQSAVKSVDTYIASGEAEDSSEKSAKEAACTAAKKELISYVFGLQVKVSEEMLRTTEKVELSERISANSEFIRLRSLEIDSHYSKGKAQCKVAYPIKEAELEKNRIEEISRKLGKPPEWVTNGPNEDSTFFYVVGRASNQNDEAKAYALAYENAVTQLIREAFGINRRLGIAETVSSPPQSSAEVLIRLVQAGTFREPIGDGVFNLSVLYRHKKSEISIEKKRIESLPKSGKVTLNSVREDELSKGRRYEHSPEEGTSLEASDFWSRADVKGHFKSNPWGLYLGFGSPPGNFKLGSGFRLYSVTVTAEKTFLHGVGLRLCGHHYAGAKSEDVDDYDAREARGFGTSVSLPIYPISLTELDKGKFPSLANLFIEPELGLSKIEIRTRRAGTFSANQVYYGISLGLQVAAFFPMGLEYKVGYQHFKDSNGLKGNAGVSWALSFFWRL